ncbi:patatin-like phospholipase family protein [Hydrocarboniclastica marina]|mgnify:CR=1 FL=1|uniref:Patatin-like phospholipase family protein n=1 Tax=Hydrocarboniclastica marina TaxID=2259620 RepID=A0A4P7XFZ7_9ALTE|nr:patatin-like phospholipase family protein [Hydrocarboniclastica marina]MAL98795.1 hypothetical protein [Alteromonadaceae bacterium]QCF24677.1 patatin-like phospholipase family protein [Hydrocarboniclastica marina]
MGRSLDIRAGAVALAHIRERGLAPADVAVLAGAAGGPKALGLQGLDLALFGDWLRREACAPRSLIGASVGSWRFASVCLPDPVAGLRRLGDLYTAQRFPKGITVAEISRRCATMLDDLVGDELQTILHNTDYRLNILIARSKGLIARDHRLPLSLGLAAVVSANLLHRRLIGRFFERVVAHDPRLPPPLHPLSDLPSHAMALSHDNLKPTLLASGSIPMIMNAIEVPGAPEGVYRDGGLTDYHLDLPYRGEGLVLFPHFTDRVIPGWFDKGIPWRRHNPKWLERVVLVSPSREYLQRLPHQKLPDRKDFSRYLGNDVGRERYWRKAMSESQRLGEEFLALVDSGRIKDAVLPL